MSHNNQPLADQLARTHALISHDRSLLVEAGAGSGKTAIMAGRITLMLAEGIEPKSIAAVTFTELAASELLIRVRKFVTALLSENIPRELRSVLIDGVTSKQRENLILADRSIDEITCTTIHGFCQKLIKPYPVEANIDPGATILDSGEADLAFQEIIDTWLRDRLSQREAGLIAALVSYDANDTVKTIESVLQYIRKRRTIKAPEARPVDQALNPLMESINEFISLVEGFPFQEPETQLIVQYLKDYIDSLPTFTSEDNPGAMVDLLLSEPNDNMLTEKGAMNAYQKTQKWINAARKASFSEEDGRRCNGLATAAYKFIKEKYVEVKENTASIILGLLINEVSPVIERFQNYKRDVARLDFDDLIFAARELLRKHDQVRKLLSRRYTHILVDEFQDTDPIQTEIFWRLCGDPASGSSQEDWQNFKIRPGALFLVGDPKQAIYRFRGADVSAYVAAREIMLRDQSDSVISISTNFRSQEPILKFVNSRFEEPLSREGQPGFIGLDASVIDHENRPCVAALDISFPENEGKVKAEAWRDKEADAIADLCAKLIGDYQIRDADNRNYRPCQPGDIALLAPSGTDLWRYESALEKLGIPVATQAGKGLYKRQEIQDLIALTRVLADGRDSLALGALLRGPLVGLTEEQLLDLVWDLSSGSKHSEELAKLSIYVDTKAIRNLYARDIFEKLQSLRRGVNSITPHALISKGIDVLRVRPILALRHGNQAERALSNVDLFLSFARPYAARGLRAFSEAITTAWKEESRQAEGRPDAQERAVALYTMHSAKGLEWPVVIPINIATEIKAPEPEIVDRLNDRIYRPVFKISPSGYTEVRDQEKDELEKERVRLWYVATTRARELLIIPRANQEAAKNSWIKIVDLDLVNLEPLEISGLSQDIKLETQKSENSQTREIFAHEAEKISQVTHQLKWLTPSKHDAIEVVLSQEMPEIVIDNLADTVVEVTSGIEIKGSTKRGLIIHKLIEEALTGEVSITKAEFRLRAIDLIEALGEISVDQAKEWLSADEIASSCYLALNLPEIKQIRDGELRPEVSIYASEVNGSLEKITRGFADAIAYKDGKPDLVIDWKSDVSPSQETIEKYKSQVKAYLSAVNANKGMLVFVTSGKIVSVNR